MTCSCGNNWVEQTPTRWFCFVILMSVKHERKVNFQFFLLHSVQFLKENFNSIHKLIVSRLKVKRSLFTPTKTHISSCYVLSLATNTNSSDNSIDLLYLMKFLMKTWRIKLSSVIAGWWEFCVNEYAHSQNA